MVIILPRQGTDFGFDATMTKVVKHAQKVRSAFPMHHAMNHVRFMISPELYVVQDRVRAALNPTWSRAHSEFRIKEFPSSRHPLTTSFDLSPRLRALLSPNLSLRFTLYALRYP